MAIVKAGEKGCDFSFAKPPAARLLELGFTFVVGYVSTPPASPAKNISKAQCEGYLAAGLKVLLVWEMSATSPNQGAGVGAVHGRDAKIAAALRNYPTDVPILCAVDTNTTTANIDAHEGYVRAFAAQCAPYPVGIYGDTDILARCSGLWRCGWVPNAWSWSGSSRVNAEAKARLLGAHVLQRTGFRIDGQWAVDPNEAIKDFPAWGTTAPVPIPPEPPDPVEEDMKAILYTVTDPAVGGAWFYVSPERVVAAPDSADEVTLWVAAGALERDVPADEFRLQLATFQPLGKLHAQAQHVLGVEASADWAARATSAPGSPGQPSPYVVTLTGTATPGV
jgi:hypothetical protein